MQFVTEALRCIYRGIQLYQLVYSVLSHSWFNYYTVSRYVAPSLVPRPHALSGGMHRLGTRLCSSHRRIGNCQELENRKLPWNYVRMLTFQDSSQCVSICYHMLGHRLHHMPKQSGNTTQCAELRPETKLVTLGEGEGGGGEWSNLAYLVSVILHRHTTVPSFLTSPRLLG